MKYLLIPLFCVSIVSCVPSDEEAKRERKAFNTQSLTEPLEIALSDGKVAKRYEYRNPDNLSERTHYIYVVDGSITATNNTTHRVGKVEATDVTVVIDGKKYIPAEK